MTDDRKNEPVPGGLPPSIGWTCGQAAAAVKEFLPLLQAIAEGSAEIDAKQLAAHTALALTGISVELVELQMRLHESYARLSLIGSALLAGDTLVRGGVPSLLLPDTARVFEQWMIEAARAQSILKASQVNEGRKQ